MKFYFAWVAPTDNVFIDAYKREDELVFDFNISQTEGDFASLDLTVTNPRIGLLAPGRQFWAWFAYEHPTLGTTPLFFGRLVGVPEDLQEEQVKLTFIARPEDFAAQKASVAESLKVAPYWDPIWFSADTVDDPDNVLESRPEVWHTDRVTGVVSASNIIIGEDGTIVLGAADVFYDSIRMHYGAPPIRTVEVTAAVAWAQKATGGVDISQSIRLAFAGKDSENNYSVTSWTGEGLSNSWPKPGTSLGGGWEVAPQSSIIPVLYRAGLDLFSSPDAGALVGPQVRGTWTPFEDMIAKDITNWEGGLRFVKTFFDVNMVLAYDVNRQRGETLSFSLSADVQSVITDPGDEEILQISLSSSELTQPIDAGGAVPIRDQRNASYFSTERGAVSLEYLLTLARSRLLARARCVNIDVEIPFDDGIAAGLSCRKNIAFSDARLPGGLAAGKIIDYSFSLDGDTGKANCAITFACTVGKGNSVEAVAGDPVYVEDAYVEASYQQRTGQLIMPIPGEVVYEPIEGDPANDDGLNFYRLSQFDIVKSVEVINGADSQAQFPFHGPIDQFHRRGLWSQYYFQAQIGGLPAEYDPVKAIAALNEMPTQVTLTLKSVTGGPFHTDYAVNVSDLMIPRLIDLEASA